MKKKKRKERELIAACWERISKGTSKYVWVVWSTKELMIEKTRNYLRGYRRSLKEKSAKCRGMNLSSPEIHVILFAIPISLVLFGQGYFYQRPLLLCMKTFTLVLVFRFFAENYSFRLTLMICLFVLKVESLRDEADKAKRECLGVKKIAEEKEILFKQEQAALRKVLNLV